MLFLVHVSVLIGLYALLVLSLQLSIGRGRVLFVAPTVFFAIGAYCSALLTTKLGLHPFVATGLGAILAGCVGYATSLLALRLSGDHLLLASLGLCEITRSVLNNFDWLTNGSIGVMNIPALISGLSPTEHHYLVLVLTSVLLVGCLLFVQRVIRSPFGHIHASLHEDEAGTAALGQPVRHTKRLGIAWGAVWASLAGSLFAHYAAYVDPTSFTVTEAIMVFAMLIVGGLKHPAGAVFGAAIFILLPELLRFAGIPGHLADPLRRVACGFLLLGVVRFCPHGMVAPHNKLGFTRSILRRNSGNITKQW